jgi:hypothetical protein
MAGLSIAGGENSKPVNNDGSEHRHPDNVSPIAAMPTPKPLVKTPEKEDDNDGDKMNKDVYKAKPAATSANNIHLLKPTNRQTTGRIQGDR